jgi:D-sedoheptulose 7-phosphate isomerase
MATHPQTTIPSSAFAEDYRSKLTRTLAALDMEQVGKLIDLLARARDQQRHIFVCGNGGSASTASHFVTDMVKGASYERKERFRIIALTDSLSTITAYSNDVSYECVFLEQLKNFAQRDDLLIAISGSGNSPNVLRAVEYGKSVGCKTVGLTGRDGGKLGPLVDLQINVAEPHMGRIEDSHLFVLHMVCYYFMEN